MAEVRVEKLYKRFGTNVVAVNAVDLTIADGEFLVMVGPSGCGKTTTLRCIAGLEQQTSGDILIGSRVVNDLPPADRDIAFVFQFYALYPHLSAFDNIAFPLRAQKMPPAEVNQRVRMVAKTLKIEHVLKRRPSGLPSGEQQRVALGRAMVRRPQVFLMDEPLTNLDAAFRADMRVELKRLQQELGTTMIYVTHDQTEAMSMGQRIAVMHKGLLQQVGTPLEVYDRPATLFVAGFIGSPPMNMIDCAVSDDPALVDSGGAFRLPISPKQKAHIRAGMTGEIVVLGARAEDITLLTDPDAGEMQGTIVTREPLGDETIYAVAIDGTRLLAKTPPTLRLDPGTKVGLRFDASRIHVFDKSSEQAIR